eukprot:scaffold68315_cov68-Phaeocystis_antarctica.AAC.2
MVLRQDAVQLASGGLAAARLHDRFAQLKLEESTVAFGGGASQAEEGALGLLQCRWARTLHIKDKRALGLVPGELRCRRGPLGGDACRHQSAEHLSTCPLRTTAAGVAVARPVGTKNAKEATTERSTSCLSRTCAAPDRQKHSSDGTT